MPIITAPQSSFSSDTVEHYAAMAGDDFSWPVAGTSRIPSSYLKFGGFRAKFLEMLVDAQNGMCPVCGCIVERAEVNHVVAAGPARKGYAAGNVFAGCKACNAKTAPEYDADGNVVAGIPVLTMEYFERPDVIPMSWTPFPILCRS